MKKEELKERIYELKKEINGLYNLALQLGNKHPENNFMIKDGFNLIQKLEKKLADYEE